MIGTRGTALAFLVAALSISVLAEGADKTKTKTKTAKKFPSLKLLNKYPHVGTNGDTYSEGLDFYKGYLWHTTKTGLTKLDPKKKFAVVNTWKFTHQSHTESAVWFKGVLYNFTYKVGKAKSNSIFKLTLNEKDYKAEVVGSGLGVTDWGSCRDNSPLKPGTETAIIYTAEGRGLDNQLLWYDPATKKTTKKLKVTGFYRIEDIGLDRYGTIWASSYHRAYRNRFFRIDLKSGKVIETFAGPEDLKSKIIDGIAIRSLKDHDVMYVTGKRSRFIYEYQVPKPGGPKAPAAEKKK